MIKIIIILLLSTLCFAQEGQNIGQSRSRTIMPHRLTGVALQRYQRYQAAVFDYQRKVDAFYTKNKNVLSDGYLNVQDPAELERRLHNLKQVTISMKDIAPPASIATYEQRVAFEAGVNNQIKQIDAGISDFYRQMEENKNKARSNVITGWIVNTVITIAAAALAPVSFGTSLAAGGAAIAANTAQTAYTLYNIDNRSTLDALKFLQSDEYKASHSAAAAINLGNAIVTGGFGFTTAGTFDVMKSFNSVTSIASVHMPFASAGVQDSFNKMVAVGNFAAAGYNLTTNPTGGMGDISVKLKQYDTNASQHYARAATYAAVRNVMDMGAATFNLANAYLPEKDRANFEVSSLVRFTQAATTGLTYSRQIAAMNEANVQYLKNLQSGTRIIPDTNIIAFSDASSEFKKLHEKVHMDPKQYTTVSERITDIVKTTDLYMKIHDKRRENIGEIFSTLSKMSENPEARRLLNTTRGFDILLDNVVTNINNRNIVTGQSLLWRQ